MLTCSQVLIAHLRSLINLLVYVNQKFCSYRYQLPPGEPNHSCGGVDIWADVARSSKVFCSAGSYCPSTVKKLTCSHGNYCRTGSQNFGLQFQMQFGPRKWKCMLQCVQSHCC